MRIWAIILIAYFGGAYLLRDDFMTILFEAKNALWIVFIGLVLIATAFATPIRNLLGMFSEERHNALFALLTIFCIGGIEFIQSERKYSDQKSETAALAMVGIEASINRSWDGHFRTIAKVNGADIGLMVDTGASLVLLRHDDALRAGIPLNLLDFNTPLTTANGKSYVAPFIIESLSVGDVTLNFVKAAVAQEGALHSSLLGMSFLENLDETVIKKNRMILRK